MPGQTITAAPTDGDEEDEGTTSTASTTTVSLSPEQVINSPEYKALRKQLRQEARTRGDAVAELARVRESQAAAEAERLAQQEERIREVLGPDGLSAWNQLADLSASDPVAAANLLAGLMAQSQQAPPPGEQTTPSQTQEDEQVPTPPVGESTPPPMPSGVAASAPLAPSSTDPWTPLIEDSQRIFDEIVERNQNPLTRNRVTMRDRGNAMMAFLRGSYAKAFKERGAP